MTMASTERCTDIIQENLDCHMDPLTLCVQSDMPHLTLSGLSTIHSQFEDHAYSHVVTGAVVLAMAACDGDPPIRETSPVPYIGDQKLYRTHSTTIDAAQSIIQSMRENLAATLENVPYTDLPEILRIIGNRDGDFWQPLRKAVITKALDNTT